MFIFHQLFLVTLVCQGTLQTNKKKFRIKTPPLSSSPLEKCNVILKKNYVLIFAA